MIRRRGGGLGGGWTTISSIITKAIVATYKCGNGSYDCIYVRVDVFVYMCVLGY